MGGTNIGNRHAPNQKSNVKFPLVDSGKKVKRFQVVICLSIDLSYANGSPHVLILSAGAELAIAHAMLRNHHTFEYTSRVNILCIIRDMKALP